MRTIPFRRSSRWLSAGLAALLATMPPAEALVRGSAHGLNSAQLRELRGLPIRAVLPGVLPPGYQLKNFQVETGPHPSYQIDYRCFCSGVNFTIELIGTAQPLKPKAPGSQRENLQVKGLGTHLQLAYYPPGSGIAQPFYLSSWLSKPPLQIGVLSAFEGHPAPAKDLRIFIQGLTYLP